MNEIQLIAHAREAREQAYAPYSHFAVGAALLATDGRVFSGCNVENISFGLTNCAERTALFSAVAAGVTSFSKVVVISDSAEPVSMCGACRQALAEFCDDLEILSVNLSGETFRTTLTAFLPRAKTGIAPRSST